MTKADILLKNQLELHYYLANKNAHSINSFDLNKCEYHFLQIVKEVSDLLGLDIDVESQAIKEGGIVEIKNFLSRTKPYMINFFLSILGGLLVYYLTTDRELKVLQKQELILAIEEHKLQISKLKEETQLGTINDKVIHDTIEVLSNDSSIKRQKSNYYKVIQSNHNITDVSFTQITNDIRQQPLIVNKSDFYKYISKSDELPMIIDDNAKIEIISPVLKYKNYSWRGLYNGEPIYFKLKDSQFKQKVINKEVSFANGFTITCLLHVRRKYNDKDQLECKYEVITIIDYITEEITIETQQGKLYRKTKDAERMQGSLFNFDEI